MLLPQTTVGRKILIAITGQMMVLFVIFHVLGNASLFFSNLNAYAAAVHTMPLLLWSFRVFMAAVLIIHVYLGIVLTLENWKAKPQSSVVTNHLSATFAGRNMIWTGSLIGGFLVYHLLHFTFQIIDPAASAVNNADALGRPDVLMMVIRSFQDSGIAILYITSLAGLLLHLTHGIQSSFQTWGLNTDKSFPIIARGGQIAATVLFLGFAAIPVSIVMGIVK